MPRSLAPIPVEAPIVDPKTGFITNFFRLRWQSLIDGYQAIGTLAQVQKLGQTGPLGTFALYTTKAAGLYRVSYYLRKTVADGVSSSLTWTWGWTETGVPLTESAAALTIDTTLAEQSGSKVIWSDAGVDLTGALAYASNTPNRMTYRVDGVVEYLQ